MSLMEHAKTELRVLGYSPKAEEGPNKWIYENVIELMEVFRKQGHSGMSAPHVVDLFCKLASCEPLAPLTGEDEEWSEPFNDEGTVQNKRHSSIFKKNGVAYELSGYIFWHWSERDLEPDEEGYPGTTKYKATFTSAYSSREIEFPYTPLAPVHIEVDSYEVDKETGERKKGTGWWHTDYPKHVVERTNKLREKLGIAPLED